jgi:hypothetical protein
MRDSTKLGLAIVLGASFALVHCSGDDDAGSGSPGTAGTHAGSAGSSTGASGTNGASGSGISTGASGSAGVGGNAGSSGGTAGSGGTGGSSGAGGTAGATGGNGGGTDAGKTDGAAGAATDAGSTDAAEGGPVSCADETIGASDAGADDAGTTTTAIVLIDSVVIKDAANANVVEQWQFDDATKIEPGLPASRPGDKWSRPPYSPIDIAASASNTFLACAGNPAAGSMKEVVPFTAFDQYYEVSVLFAEHDYSSYHVTAKVKLVAGGRSDAACRAHAHIYGIDAAASAETPPAPITLMTGQWQEVTLTIPATGFTRIRELGIRITTYGC